jgi:hypothetical protein
VIVGAWLLFTIRLKGFSPRFKINQDYRVESKVISLLVSHKIFNVTLQSFSRGSKHSLELFIPIDQINSKQKKAFTSRAPDFSLGW